MTDSRFWRKVGILIFSAIACGSAHAAQTQEDHRETSSKAYGYANNENWVVFAIPERKMCLLTINKPINGGLFGLEIEVTGTNPDTDFHKQILLTKKSWKLSPGQRSIVNLQLYRIRQDFEMVAVAEHMIEISITPSDIPNLTGAEKWFIEQPLQGAITEGELVLTINFPGNEAPWNVDFSGMTDLYDKWISCGQVMSNGKGNGGTSPF